MDKRLLVTKKNETFEMVKTFGFDPSDFQWADQESSQPPHPQVSALLHKPSDYFFVFDYTQMPHIVGLSALYSPGLDTKVIKRFTRDWETQILCFTEWLHNLRRETSAPDLWAAIAQEKKLAEAASSSETPNSPFTPEEQQSLTDRIREIERYVIEIHKLTGEQAEFVKRRLDYLADSVKRLGRLDWFNIALSVLVTIVIDSGLASSAASELLQFAGTLLSPFFGGTPPLPLGA